ncbi:thiamine biosynthesis lipoprotein [Nicoletella semolina]|uniref:FAD:protein FMN transferase n=1 Tax=Nicoletella semolina TaxID=271160 RepID=A0A4R2N6R1_9PAST|nr:FAD:protein FMN transferase [Nicoletella semolina]MDH2925205.1 thiamine biosynthesis protein ApbE [Nicoletella semolina]TCP16485.1 thiamine biosynthesis lipoprotein [Nicoletella semolina]
MKKICLLIVTLFALAACEKEPEQISLSGKTMGTTYHVKYIDDGNSADLPKPEEVKEALDKVLKQVNDEMSTYQKDSQISRFNVMQEADKFINISADFAKVLNEAIRLNKVTEGALDVTIGQLVNLWGFGPDKRMNKVPSEEQIAERAKTVGIDKIQLNGNKLSKKVANLYLDLSSIAKGFGVDKLSEQLEHYGISRYMVEIGGEIRAEGKNLHGRPWQIAIENPELERGVSAKIVVPLDDFGMATSGDYRNYFEDEQGHRLSHIIDPKQYRPISHNLASITVFAPSAMTADGLSTGLFVLGADKALEIAEREKLAVFLIVKTPEGFETKMSSELEKLLK